MKHFRPTHLVSLTAWVLLAWLLPASTFAAPPSPSPHAAFIPAPKPPNEEAYFSFVEGLLQLSPDQRSNLLITLQRARLSSDKIAAKVAPSLGEAAHQFTLALRDAAYDQVDTQLIEDVFVERQQAIGRISAEYENALWEFASTSLTQGQSANIPVVVSLIRRLVIARATTPTLLAAGVEPVTFVFGGQGRASANMTPAGAQQIGFILGARDESLARSALAMHEATWKLQVDMLKEQIDAAAGVSDSDRLERIRQAYAAAYPDVATHALHVEALINDLTAYLSPESRQSVVDQWVRITAPSALAGEVGLNALLVELMAEPTPPELHEVVADASSSAVRVFDQMVKRERRAIDEFARTGVSATAQRVDYIKDMLALREQRALLAKEVTELLPDLVGSNMDLHRRMQRLIDEEFALITRWREDLERRTAPEWPRL